jgi:hypothetical protein
VHAVDPTTYLMIGALIFPDRDQCDFTGPFEALSRVPNSRFLTRVMLLGTPENGARPSCRARRQPQAGTLAPAICTWTVPDSGHRSILHLDFKEMFS